MNEGEIIDTSGGGLLNWGQLIMRQVDRCMSIASQDLMQKTNEDRFRNSVRALECLLIPYEDELYQHEKEEIKKLDQPIDAITTLDEFYLWLQELCKLAGRCGLMPIEEDTGYDEGYNKLDSEQSK